MKIRRIAKSDPNRGFCSDCHTKADLEIDFGRKHPSLRLCARCGRYLGGVVINRIAEAEAGVPIPEPGTRPCR